MEHKHFVCPCCRKAKPLDKKKVLIRNRKHMIRCTDCIENSKTRPHSKDRQ